MLQQEKPVCGSTISTLLYLASQTSQVAPTTWTTFYFFYLANSSLSFKNQLSCHSSRKPFLSPPQHLFAKARLNVPLLWFHKALCIAPSVIWLYFFFFASPPSGILVPLPGIRPAPPELKAWSLNYWTAWEVSGYISLYLFKGLSPHSTRLNSTRTGEHLIHLFFPLGFYSSFLSLLLLLLSHFSHVRLLATPRTAAHQAPPSMGFSRQEY